MVPAVFEDSHDSRFETCDDGWSTHSAIQHQAPDPFGCPCCANVFREILSGTDIDVAAQAREMARRHEGLCGSAFVTNAQILTMNANAPLAEAMLVKDGKIVWLGNSADAPASAADETSIDCQGKVVLPGFIEPHMHLAPLAMLHSFENVGPFRFPSAQAALRHLSILATDTPVGDWVVGRQFDPSLQEGAGEGGPLRPSRSSVGQSLLEGLNVEATALEEQPR